MSGFANDLNWCAVLMGSVSGTVFFAHCRVTAQESYFITLVFRVSSKGSVQEF